MQAHQIFAVVMGAYGVVVGTMGLAGYVKAKSVMSVVAGELGFVLSAVSAGLLWVHKPSGMILGMATAGVLVGAFTMRLIRTKKFMPAGLMLALSLGVFGALLAGYLQNP